MKRLVFFSLLCVSALTQAEHNQAYSNSETDEVVIYGEQLFKDTTQVSPTSVITAEDFEHFNVTTVEDAISLEPSLIVRKRFIGDPNGVIGIRGSNMFQGHRSLVFADGLPLHYHLQTRFSGAPRWSLVSPDEIEEIEVIYGPFSAEYAGNSMGGVVNILTKEPTERRIVLEGNFFAQQYDVRSTDENYLGGKFFGSFEDKIGNLSIFASYNHLQNESQPQTQFFNSASGAGGTVVNGALSGVNATGDNGFYIGDSGAEEAITDLFKIKFGYDLGDYHIRTSLAYEERERDLSDLNSFLTDATGNTIWSGPVTFNGTNLNISGTTFQERYQERNSLLLGLGFSGPLSDNWLFDLYYSNFEILKDEEIRSGRNPNDPTFIAVNQGFGGRLTDANDTGWQTVDLKAGTENLFGNGKGRLSVGGHYDRYKLSINPYNYDSINNLIGSARSFSGGETNTYALFAQFGYEFHPQWDLGLGLRYEHWQANGGFSGTRQVDKRDEQGLSPKFSLVFFPTNDITLRYSLARAIRFPLVEELFRNESTGIRQFVSDPNLEPEDGIHHNLLIQKDIKGGFFRVNIFHETIDDVIFTFSAIDLSNNTITTTLPVGEVETTGVEFVYNQIGIFNSPFDIRYNMSYTDSEITDNPLNRSIEGRQFPRIPYWRSNLLLTYNVNSSIDVSTSVRYASNSFGQLDNSDRESNVFGAQDSFVFVNLKGNWRVNNNFKVGAGVDNVFNEEAYVFHPWPFRTFFLEGKYVF